jgi:hypothetical protein
MTTTDDARQNEYVPSRYERFRHEFWLIIARCLPRSLLYAAAIVVGSHANTGKWRDDDVNELKLVDVYRRWWHPNY